MFFTRSLSLPDFGRDSMKTIIKFGSTVESLYMSGRNLRKIPEEVLTYLRRV